MSEGNTEMRADSALPETAADDAVSAITPEASETAELEISEVKIAEAEIAEVNPAETQDAQADITSTDKTQTEAPDSKSKTYEEAYEKLYTDILEHFRSFSPAEQIAGKITEEHITEYLEANREERIQQYRERREKRLLAALELFAVLGTIIAVVNFLRNDPAILVNILYIIGALGAFFLWKHPRSKDDKK